MTTWSAPPAAAPTGEGAAPPGTAGPVEVELVAELGDIAPLTDLLWSYTVDYEPVEDVDDIVAMSDLVVSGSIVAIREGRSVRSTRNDWDVEAHVVLELLVERVHDAEASSPSSKITIGDSVYLEWIWPNAADVPLSVSQDVLPVPGVLLFLADAPTEPAALRERGWLSEQRVLVEPDRGRPPGAPLHHMAYPGGAYVETRTGWEALFAEAHRTQPTADHPEGEIAAFVGR